MASWYAEMPEYARPVPPDSLVPSAKKKDEEAKDKVAGPSKPKFTIEEHFKSNACVVCGKSAASQGISQLCFSTCQGSFHGRCSCDIVNRDMSILRGAAREYDLRPRVDASGRPEAAWRRAEDLRVVFGGATSGRDQMHLVGLWVDVRAA